LNDCKWHEAVVAACDLDGSKLPFGYVASWPSTYAILPASDRCSTDPVEKFYFFETLKSCQKPLRWKTQLIFIVEANQRFHNERSGKMGLPIHS